MGIMTKHILLVDDDALMRRSLAFTLEQAGYRVVTAQSGEEALRCIEAYRCTHSQWVPTMFTRLLKLPEEDRRRYDLSSLRGAIHAAAGPRLAELCERQRQQQAITQNAG